MPEQVFRGGAVPEKANPTFQGSVRAAVWLWVKYAMRVTQLGTKLGLGRFVAARTATAAALRGGTHRRVPAVPVQDPGCKRLVELAQGTG